MQEIEVEVGGISKEWYIIRMRMKFPHEILIEIIMKIDLFKGSKRKL